MRRALAVAASLCLAACLQVGTGPGSGAGFDAGAGADGGGTPSAVGATCQRDPTGQVTLCVATSACPAVTVDPGAFPSCGFRLGAASALDVECVCGDMLCSAGSPQSCPEVSRLLAAQSSLTVCDQASLGRCVSLSIPDATPATCTPACRSECAGVLDCLTTCGC